MDYEKKYKEALEKIKRYVTDEFGCTRLKPADIFSELKESEDEKIRKALISFLKSPFVNENITDEKVNPWISWLEKQGWQKPKFRVGDTIKCKYDDRQFTIKSINLDKGTYTYTREGFGNDIDYADEKFELVEQNPGWSEKDEKHFSWLIKYLSQSTGLYDNLIDWLKSIKDRVQPQQEWSEEDDQYLLVCKNALRKYQTSDKWDAEIISHWLENKLKAHQATWKPSNEQMYALANALSLAKNCGEEYAFYLRTLYEQLNKLRKE